MKKFLAALMALTVAGSAFATEIYVSTGHSNNSYSYNRPAPRPHHGPDYRRDDGPRHHHRGNAYGHNKHRGPHGGPGHHRGPGPR